MRWDTDDVVLSHPHDFFRLKRLAVKHGTCFVLMPFASEFDLVFEHIAQALKGMMICKRADDLRLGKPILERILRGIATSELVIADLTGQNPNVFYELALAHSRTKDVLLLAQSIDDVPFDLRSYFCHIYSRNSEKDLEGLRNTVRESATDVASRRLPMMLETVSLRTERIVDYMESLIKQPDDCRGLLIRIQASISSLGNLRMRDSEDPESRRYSHLLERERELLVRLIEHGARLQAVLCPRRISTDLQEPPEERNQRLNRVISFLRGEHECLSRCELVVSPNIGSNLLFFGEEIEFEGYKTQIERGFGWTEVVVDPQLIASRIGVFDQFFESAREFTLERYVREQGGESTEVLRNAVISSLEEAKKSERN